MQRRLFRDLARQIILLLQVPQIAAYEEGCNRNGNDDGKESIHGVGPDSEKPKQHRHDNVHERQYCKSITKRFVHYMPPLEYLLGMGKKYDAPGKQHLLPG
jgi:hypothetical protein